VQSIRSVSTYLVGVARSRAFSRRCQVGDGGNVESCRLVMASHGTCNSGHLSPCAECRVTSGAVFSGGHAVAAELEVVVDPAYPSGEYRG
jgi:hypothetical protein